ncbi:FKBP-type peptidyl-prolyl cis-trans isomerase [Chitinophaga oryzae]|uniref:Peptidyl-prolyl cis-trans isomerase n=1 Tax=Chitinophaga oryzae TaxID=2725414 RepID=A0AAE7D800_9BACT|nr:FKBP-type peptidyl-prolyl cis-trans isomerase [Chitinophaga oryzae]QJB32776.1 FKBP-type peptidyl-prolyl cis-trans isomerase [Chitinophaga oryzae]QJB39229.1 FKBP-type peptidyl-prolyl cis-trans isomerase [Chitinophaga oryzae]
MKLLLKIALACLPVFTLLSCSKKADDMITMDAAETDTRIQQYLFAHNEIAVRDPSGLYYRIYKPGDSVHFVKPASVVYVNYSNQLIDGTIVDASFDVTNFNNRELKNHIPAWQIGLAKISKGGKIRMYIPPYLAFGSMGVPDIIPPNAILISEVELVDIK